MRWEIATCDEAAANRLAEAAGLSPVVARLLLERGVADPESAARFLSPSLSHLYSPYAMAGMKSAVERLRAAIARKEKVLIYGDYDVDGTTAVVILKTAIELCGGSAEFHVPHRIRDGYGMQDEVIERAAADGVRLIISVDTGIRAFSAAEAAARCGLDLIVTDHHLPEGRGLPRAVAVLNPNQAGCEYPCKALCGAGVAFKLAQALLEAEQCRKTDAERERLLLSFLKLVAIATIADAVPLLDENRVFARLGLEALQKPVHPGLKALLEVAELGTRPLRAGDVAFRLAPRLNAAGRMDVARDVIDLFTLREAEECKKIAARLNRLNQERQEAEQRIVAAVQDRLDSCAELREAYCIVVDGDDWHRGVIGIVATRVVERYHRPALVLSRDGEEAYGSGRSIPTFHLLEALETCPELFTRFGGHAHAIGCSLPVARVPELRAALETCARARLTPADFVPGLAVDAEVELEQVTPKLYEAVQQLQPFGMDNPEPVFAARRVKVLQPPRVLKEKHIKLRLSQPSRRGSGRGWDALGWRMAESVTKQAILAGDGVDIAFTLEQNDHPDFGGLELRLEDIQRLGEWGKLDVGPRCAPG